MSIIPGVLPQQTWIAYQLNKKDGEQEKILDQRVYHSASSLARAFVGGWIDPLPQTDRGRTSRSILVFYGLDGAVLEPISELSKFYGEYGLDVGTKVLTTVIESWRRR